MSRISIKAIAAGFLVDIGGSTIAATALGIIVGTVYPIHGVSLSEIEIKSKSTAMLASCLVIGFIFTFLGGFIAARLAKSSEIIHAGIVGVAGVLLGSLLCRTYPLWFNVPAFVLTIPIALMGGYVVKKSRYQDPTEPCAESEQKPSGDF